MTVLSYMILTSHRLVMGSRSGDMDPAVPLHMMSTLNLSPKEMDTSEQRAGSGVWSLPWATRVSFQPFPPYLVLVLSVPEALANTVPLFFFFFP